ncbi:MAG TPA: PP2C family protein-serine/threonine phosphatase [Thermoleophilia bacterium]|nr:PP2C family protein-serine/threonine phosphatase [Thermoleophilia bacterium]
MIEDRDDERVAGQRVTDGFRRLLFPPDPPVVPGLEVACLYRQAGALHEGSALDGIGGDFVDFYGGRGLSHVAMAVGDISGKGLEAALRAIAAKFMLRGLVSSERWPLPPGSLLMDATNALLELLRDDPGRFVTLAIISVDARDGLVAVSLAGHPAPAVIRADRVERPLQFLLPAIGVTSDAELQALPSEEVRLEPGDALLLFTDGLSEAHTEDGRFYEDERLEEALGELRDLPAAQLLERLLDDAAAFAGRPPSDDVALVLVRRTAEPENGAQPAPR